MRLPTRSLFLPLLMCRAAFPKIGIQPLATDYERHTPRCCAEPTDEKPTDVARFLAGPLFSCVPHISSERAYIRRSISRQANEIVELARHVRGHPIIERQNNAMPDLAISQIKTFKRAPREFDIISAL
jgi:hypothetical protein